MKQKLKITKEISGQKECVAEVLRSIQGKVQILDISESTGDSRIMTFDCRIESPFGFSGEGQENESEIWNPSDLLAQDLIGPIIPEEIVEEIAQEIEGRLQEILYNTKIQLAYQVYKMGEITDPIFAVMSVDFGRVSKRELRSMTSIIANRQMLGTSKYVN